MDNERLEQQMAFCLEIDKEKFIGRQTYLTGADRRENDAEHAWHMAIMTILLSEYANEEIDGDERPVTSHLSRVDLKEDGKGLKIVRQSLPYGTASGTHGLYFCAYCARLHNIEQQLLSMFGDTDGKRDAMLRFTKPVTGGYYFAPSLERIQAL